MPATPLYIQRFLLFAISVLLLNLFIMTQSFAAEQIRIAVLKFGTVNWVLETIDHYKLDKKYKIELAIQPLATTQGSKIALQGGSADVVISDWTWVSRRRAEGTDFTMVPYSSAAGAVMVPANSSIKSLADLKGKKIAIAGGPLDKSWLFLRAYSKKELGYDLADQVEPVYGAPPLLVQKALQGEFDAVLNFWHYSARLKAKEFSTIISVEDMMTGLGAAGRTSVIGFVFSEHWAKQNRNKLKAFLAAIKEAIAILDRDDKAWLHVRPLMKAENEAIFLALRDSFRSGILRRPLVVEQADVERLYKIIAKLGGQKLTGKAATLTDGSFWLPGDIAQQNGIRNGN